MTLHVDDVWPTAWVPTSIVVEPVVVVVVADGSDAPIMEAERTQIGVWAIPWPQLIVLVGALLLIAAAIMGRIRSRRRVAQLVAAAREEGARNATASNDTTPPIGGAA